MSDLEPTIPAVSRRSAQQPRLPSGRGRPSAWKWLLAALAIVVGAVVICGGVLLLAYQQRPALPPGAFPTPVLRTIAAPAPTVPVATTGGAEATAPPGADATATAVATFPPPPPGTLKVGAHVQVVNTGGDGLSLRQGPGLDSPRVAIAIEGELLEVTDGPRVIAGMTWWKLKRTDGVEGWGVQNFLQLVP